MKDTLTFTGSRSSAVRVALRRSVLCLAAAACVGPLAAQAAVPTADVERDILAASSARFTALTDRDFDKLRSLVGDSLIYLRGGAFFDGFFTNGDEYVEGTRVDPHFYPVASSQTQNMVYVYGNVAVMTGRNTFLNSTVAADVGKAGWRPLDVKPGEGSSNFLQVLRRDKGQWKVVFYAGGGARPVSMEEQSAQARARAQQNTTGGAEQKLAQPVLPKTAPLTDEGRQVLAVEKSRLGAYAAKDFDKLRSVLGDDVMYLSNGKRLIGRDAVIGSAQADKTLFTSYEVKEPVVAQFHGDVAVLGFFLETKAGNATYPTYTYSIYHRNGAGWEFVGGTSTSTRALTSMQEHSGFTPKAP